MNNLFCPNFSNREVFDEFNQMIEAFGGKSMSIEECKSSELRNLRTGLDYSAMEFAYKIYNMNNGNSLIYAPNGERSILYDTILSHVEDVKKAILLKSSFYTDEYINKNGDWLSFNKALVKYYGPTMGKTTAIRNNKNLVDLDTLGKPQMDKLARKHGLSGWREMTTLPDMSKDLKKEYRLLLVKLVQDWKNNPENKGKTLMVSNGYFVNDDSGILFDGVKRIPSEKVMIERGVGRAKEIGHLDSAEHMKEWRDNLLKKNPNLIIDDRYISEIEKPISVKLDTNGEPVLDLNTEIKETNSIINKFNSSSNKTFFGNTFDKIMSGEVVSSKDIINNILSNNLLSDQNIQIAQILKRHNIPVKISTEIGYDFMSTFTDKNGQSIVLINPTLIGNASNKLAADTLLHEVVHCLTVNAFNNPASIQDEKLVKTTNELYKYYDSVYSSDIYDRSNRSNGMYALTNQKEFVSEFITNKATRDLLYNHAANLDKQKGKTVLGKIKRFINAVSEFLINKKVFMSETDKLNQYKLLLTKYLLNSKYVTYTKYKPSQITNLIFSKLNNSTIGTDNEIILYKLISDQMSDLERNNAIYDEEEVKKSLDKMCDEIARILQTRLVALKSSNLSSDYVSQQSGILQSQIQLFKLRTISHFDIISQLMTQLMPQLLEDVKYIRGIYNDRTKIINDTEYMYHAHDNFGTYTKALDTVLKLFDDNFILEYINDTLSNDNPLNKSRIIKSVSALNEAINKTKALSEQGKRLCDSLLIRSVKNTIKEVGEKTHSLDYADYLEQLEEINFDTNVFFKYLGSLDKTKDNALRTIFHLVTEAIDKAEIKTNSKANKLLNLQEGLKLNEKIKYLYEYDNENFTTGYLVRKLNYGQFYSDYNKFIQSLNKDMNLPINNRVSPDNDTVYKTVDGKLYTVKLWWNHLRNEWLGDHCERRYTKEYYEAYSNLSQITRDRREELQSQIRLLKEKALGNDGFYHYEKLTKLEYSKLLDLYFQKRLLKDTRDINGDRKTGVELLIAKELQELDSLYKDVNIERNKEKWAEAFRNMVKECGGEEEFKKGSEGSFDFKKYDEWIDRNCEKRLKRDEDGKIILFRHISEQMPQEPVYSVNNDNGALYLSLKQEYNDLLSVRRDFATGDVRFENMSQSVTAKLKELEKRMSEVKRQAKKENSKLKPLLKQKALIFRKYTITEKTQLYKQLEEEARTGGYLQQFYNATGHFAYDEIAGESVFVPEKWYTTIIPRAEYMEEFYEIVPGKGWIDYEDDNLFVNKTFKQYESEGESMIPKAFDKNGKKLYDNSKAYKIATSGNLKLLYDEILSTIKEANQSYTNKQFQCDYLLPLIPGSIFKRGRGKTLSGKFGAIKDYIKDGIGINDVRYFDVQYGQSLTDLLDNFDEFGDVINRNEDNNQSDYVHGRRPDGRELHMIPQYYTRKLKDPSLISSDIVGIVCEYYKQALTFKNKQEIKDKCEAILDMIEKRTVKKTRLSLLKRNGADELNSSTKTITGIESNTYDAAREFLNAKLYNVKLNPHEVKLGNKTLRLGKAASLYRALTTAINLGCNIAVAGTGFLTSLGAHLVQQIVGRKYSIKDGTKATLEQIHQMVLTKSGYNYIANTTSKNKMMVLAETYNVSNQGSRKYKHSNRNRIVNAVNENWCFGFMTSLDFVVKTNIMLTVIMSYKMYNGKFVTNEDLDIMLWDKDKDYKKQAKKERENGISLYDVMDTSSGELLIKEEYKQAYNEIENKLKARINKWGEDADGMATETQKAAINANVLGAAVLTHRQYLPLMLQSRFAHTTEDLDTEMYDNGVFRSGGLFLKLLAMPLWDMLTLNYKVGKLNPSTKYSSLMGASLGVVVDAAFISSPFSFMGALTGAALGMLSSTDSNMSNKFNKYFNNKSSKKDYALSRARKAHLKQIATELIMYHLFITPIVNALSAIADDDDDDKDKIAYPIIKYLSNLVGLDSESKMLLFAAYLGRRFQWEFYTAYRGEDLLNNIKTVSAQTGTNDKIETVLSQLYKSILPRETLLDTFLQWNSLENDDEEQYDSHINRGLYSESEFKEWLTGDPRFNKLQKAIFKLFPFSHLYEQLYDSKSKRTYHENQIMKINN